MDSLSYYTSCKALSCDWDRDKGKGGDRVKSGSEKPSCPCGSEFNSVSALRTHMETEHPSAVDAIQTWGRELYPKPKGTAFIDSDSMKCSGCGLCAEACSMQHFGVINKDLARIFVRNLLLPLPKAVVVTCSQCQDEERNCEKTCPVTPPAIRFDKTTLHMVIDKDTCTGCLSCKEACGTEAIRYAFDVAEVPFVCDLCDVDNTGTRNPQCVRICPTSALQYQDRMERIRPVRDVFRRSSEAKALMIARRLYPLTRESIAFPPWQPDVEEKGAQNG